MKSHKPSKKRDLFLKILGVIFVVLMILVIPRFFKIQVPGLSSKPVHLLFVGDIMLSRNIGTLIDEHNDIDFPFLLIASTTRAADIAFANLETPVSTRGTNVGSIYSFRSDPRTIAGLTFAGFDVISVANNHTFDYGPLAFMDTQMYLDKAGIKHIGGGKDLSAAQTPAIFTKNGTTFAYLGYSQFATDYPASNTPAVAPLDLNLMKADIAKAKTVADVVIVSIHWGTEYATTSSIEQKSVAHALIDSGANLVIGHHPHVIEELEPYHGGLIIYSLGNFVFDQNFSADTREGMMLSVVMQGSKIVGYSPTIIHFTSQFQPFIPQ